MASLNELIAAAEAAGFVRSTCVHEIPEDRFRHIVLDYPEPLVDGQMTPIWRIHVNVNTIPDTTYVAEHRNGQRRMSRKGAIEWAQRIAAENPKT